ncbi:tyrosine-type recombinase/integrase [Alishewanella longhuensis]
MPKLAKTLTVLEVAKLSKQIGLHSVGGKDSPGLYLQVSSPDAISWVYRKVIDGKRHSIGMGSYPMVSLADARDKVKAYRVEVANGNNPLLAKRQLKQEAKAKAEAEKLEALRQATTFRVAAEPYLKKLQSEYSGRNIAKQIQKVANQFSTYVYPFFGDTPIDQIDTAQIAEMLGPIWLTKRETATRVRIHVYKVFDLYQAEKGITSGNPADLQLIKRILPTPSKRAMNDLKTKHQPAMELPDHPRFMALLSGEDSLSAKLLMFGILTIARPGEARHARWDQFDFERKTWTIKAAEMKSGKDHIVPLSDAALAIIESMPKLGAYTFSTNGIRPASENTAALCIKRLSKQDLAIGGSGFINRDGKIPTAHGFRSTFKDWARKYSSAPDEHSELAMAHVNSDETRNAYARDMLVDERRPLMADWEAFCFSPVAGDSKA